MDQLEALAFLPALGLLELLVPLLGLELGRQLEQQLVLEQRLVQE